MRTVVSAMVLCLLLMFLPGFAPADDLFIFPAEEQTAEQLEADKGVCVKWATEQSGFDPLATPTATTPPPTSTASSGSRGKSVVRGAAVGALIGSIDGDAGKGAAIGAGAGLLFGGMRQRDQQQADAQAKAQWEAEQAAIYEQNRTTFNNAYKLCLEAKGYAVTEK